MLWFSFIVTLVMLVLLVDRLQQLWPHLGLREHFLLIEYLERSNLGCASVLKDKQICLFEQLLRGKRSEFASWRL